MSQNRIFFFFFVYDILFYRFLFLKIMESALLQILYLHILVYKYNIYIRMFISININLQT